MEKLKEREPIFIKMGQDLWEIGLMINRRDKERKHGQMDQATVGIII